MAKDKKAPTVRDEDDPFQRDARAIINRISSTPILDGALVKATLTTGSTRVAHNLGRPYRGFIIVDSTADVRAWRDPSSGSNTSTFISLIASVAASVSLWIF